MKKQLAAGIFVLTLLVPFQNCTGTFSAQKSHGPATTTATANLGSMNFSSMTLNGPPVPALSWGLELNRFTNLIIANDSTGANYANYPTMIQDAGGMHMWYCGTGPNGSMDSIRYTHSTDARNWTPNQMVLSVTHQFPENEKGTCDPSVVRANLGDGEFYYMLYTVHSGAVGTAMNIARSAAPNGPFAKLTTDSPARWVVNALNPAMVLMPRHFANQPGKPFDYYGAGAPSLIFHNNELYAWYSDDTVDMPGPPRNQVYFVRSSNGINWSAPQPAIRDHASMDVKFNRTTGKFVWFEIEGGISGSARMITFESSDPLNFAGKKVICDYNCFPQYAGNMGISADAHGNLVNDDLFAAFGVAVDFAPHWALMREMIGGIRFARGSEMLNIQSPSLLHPVQRGTVTQLNSGGECLEVGSQSFLVAGTWTVRSGCAANFTKSFQFSSAGGNRLRIFTQYSSMCLTRDQSANVAETANCGAASETGQLWAAEARAAFGAGRIALRHLASGQCLEKSSNFFIFGECSDSANQAFALSAGALPYTPAAAMGQVATVTPTPSTPLVAAPQFVGLNRAASNDVLQGWDATRAADQDGNTAYSSAMFPGSSNSRNSYLHAWSSAGAQRVSRVNLRARMVNGRPSGFPRVYKVYVTNADESGWDLIGEVPFAPNEAGWVSVPFAARITAGVLIVPTELGRDDGGNYYFQIADVNWEP